MTQIMNYILLRSFYLRYIQLTCMVLHWLHWLGTLHGAEEGFLVFNWTQACKKKNRGASHLCKCMLPPMKLWW